MKTISLTIPQEPIKCDIEFSKTFADLWKGLEKTIGDRPYLFVTDTNIEPYFKASHEGSNFPINDKNTFVLPAGEKYKTIESVEKILDAAFQAHLDRNAVIIAVGGGVIGDITGFAASLFLRGISVIQVPTSLLAMVDASIGGKTGVNTQYGKNLVGTLNQPAQIAICYEWLQNLPEAEIKNGMCEMIKHGILLDDQHFKHFEDLVPLLGGPSAEIGRGGLSVKELFLQNAETLIPESIAVKAGIVQRDPKESQERMKLNLGHTFGHGIEKLSNYEIPHGISVAIGCVMAAQYALEEELCDEETVDRIENIFHQFGIDTMCPYEYDDVWSEMKYDKKRRGSTLNLVLPTRIGEVVIYPVEI